MKGLLDPKLVWIARFAFRAGINKACVKGGKSTVQFEVEHLRTAIAALELAERFSWRKPQELKEEDGYVRVAYRSHSNTKPEKVFTDVGYLDHDYNEREEKWEWVIVIRTISIPLQALIAWHHLPEWKEDEA